MYKTIGKSEYKNLLADVIADITAVSVKPESGVLKAGAILFQNTDGMFEPAGTAEAVDTKTLVVLYEDVDTTVDTKIAQTAAVIRGGKVIYGAVSLKSSGEMTRAIEQTLRKQGIVLVREAETKAFKNYLD